MTGVVKVSLDEMPWETVREDLKRRIVTGEKLMLAHLSFAKGSKVVMHRHHHEQFTVVLQGSVRFSLEDGSQFVAKKGEVVVIPSNIGHAAEALEDSFTFDIFSPPREDWVAGRDDYLKQRT
ncbi:MAG: cupin domain-containing protein [Candidatus Caldarchaeum sp.]|nr:cupin domain-containing protein [Candidatus Caldarchaeum sp.]